MKQSILENPPGEMTRAPGAGEVCPPRAGRHADKPVMRAVHVLRKCDPAEWGGTETAIQRLFQGLREHGVDSVVYCPQLRNGRASDPLAEAGCTVKRFSAFLPILGLPRRRRHQ